MHTLLLSGLLSGALQGLLLGLLRLGGLLVGNDLGDARVGNGVKLVIGAGAVELILIGREIVVGILVGLGEVLVIVVVIVVVGGGHVVAGERDVEVTNNLEEDLIILIDGKIKSLLVVLFYLSAPSTHQIYHRTNIRSWGQACKS